MSDLMTFIGGAAVGTLVTYMAKNEHTRKTVERFIDGVGVTFTDFLHRMTPDRKEQTASSDVEPEGETMGKAEPVKKATRGGRGTKAKKAATDGKPVH
ncbi:MAG: hypothetical protein ABFS39_18945 [Pseudomonadota bacterium]